MASNPKLDTSSSSPDGVPYGSQRSNHSNTSNLERSGARDGHDNRMLVLGSGGAGAAVNSSGAGAGSGSELPPLSQVLSLTTLALGDQKGSRHLELKRAINAALGSLASEDPQLGNLQSKPLETFGTDELKRVRSSLVEHSKSARERSKHFSEAIVKLDRFRSTLQSRKRSRPDPSNTSLSQPASAERSLSSLGVGERSVASVHTMKGNTNAPNPHVGGSDAGMPKGGDRNKRVVPNKRVRTSMADTRPDGRPTNVNPQRPSVLTDRDRDVSRPSSSLTSPAEEKERAAAPPSEGWEKTKMKGRRSGTKPDASVAALANGNSEGDREHKWSGQQHRANSESRSRPSEGHGFRSGPVHGITSVHKSESSGVQFNGVASRGTNKNERDIPHGREIPEKPESTPKLERPLKDNKPPSREDSHPANPTGLTKAKAARAPRSSSSAGGGPAHLARNTSFGDNRERHGPPPKVQAQLPSAATNRKRPAPSRSSSPPAQWVGQRPQKMARIARRVNLMPGAALAREDPPTAVSESPASRDNGGTNVGARSNPGMASGSGVARRVSVSSTHGHPQAKPKVGDRVTTSVGLSESDESEDDGDKVKEKAKKQGDWEQKATPPPTSQKMGNLVAPAKKTRVVAKEEGGDGVRRQGRSGRGAVAPRTSMVNPVLEKVEVSANAKQLRSVRVGPEKHDRPGRPPTKKDTAADRKVETAARRPRRPMGNGVSEVSGESDDDREELLNAVNMAINASGLACTNAFWKQMEPYFAHLTPADMLSLHQLTKDLEEGDSALLIPACGESTGKPEGQRNNTPPVSPSIDSGGGRSMSIANGSIELDGVKFGHSFKEKSEVGKTARKGVSGQWFERVLPLSQRLLAALIGESDIDEEVRRRDTFHDHSLYSRRDQSPHGLGSTSESDRLDGDSDGETGRHDTERWNTGGRDILPNGHTTRIAHNLHRDELGGDDEDILWNSEDNIAPVVKQEVGDDGILSGKDERGIRSSGPSSNMTAWEIHYQRMTVDERILLELQTIGINVEPPTDPAQREDDEVCEEIRKMQRDLSDQVAINKDRIHTLERHILANKEKEEMDRERLAIDKLVEIAYSKRMGTRGSSGGKSSASKGAKAASLAMVKRLLLRVRGYEAGKTCFDGALKDLLLGVAPREVESSAVVVGVPEGVTPASAPTPATSLNLEPVASTAVPQPPKPTASVSSEGPGGRSVVRRTEVKSEKDATTEARQQTMPSSADRSRGKEDGWPLRAKEREVYLEDVAGGSGMRDVNALGANVLAGTKGKRSERERDGKGHGKESHTRSDSSKVARQTGIVNAKPERKTKTKPRQKTAPLSKAVNGLLAKPTAESKDRPVAPTSTQQFVGQVKPKDEVPAAAPPLASHNIVPDSEEAVDLSNIPLPGIEDLGGQAPDLGSWLQDFDEDVNLHQGEYVMGLEVPMDDLSDLGMML
ncbi:transcriptional adapter 3 [Marchantia polymorpha subsp. ruderalis]|uniref:Uncharacterized protein n=2 Tax=Marchantia polymorpha TaxID=3197 RepID=A0AAF6AM96_MARPO|nr:hypothetical protein MARPO_0043s0055 [Marchantia polymorpha]BBM97566.1 hypothetical protein Mp_1g06630 [Marchantia polymorpha subsp. ruderalis]|eukprot:PTQ39807.1 hypothetical protein MARPO_0043s0055 [Marchantia polymorpha]